MEKEKSITRDRNVGIAHGETLTTVGAQRPREKKEKCVNPCISHVREVILLPVEWEGKCGPSCVGVRENANGGVGVANEGSSCAPTPLAHSIHEPRSRRGHQGQQARKRAPSVHVGDHEDPRGGRKQ